MTRKRIVTATSIYNRRPDLTITIQPHNKWPDQLFVSFPPCAALSKDEAYALCTALLDSFEELEADSA